jgi:hypothetical protein
VREEAREQREDERRNKPVTRVAKRVGSNVLSTIGRELVRGIFGTMKKRR